MSESILPRVGMKLGKYQLVRVLGQGGMGVVFEAQDTLLHRSVAIKVLSRNLIDDAKATERFLQEARAIGQLNHPNIVTIHEIDQVNGMLYLVMECLQDGTVQDRLRERGPFHWREATRIITDVCRGLAEAHRIQLIHRDIKPANLLFTRDQTVKLTDFGLVQTIQPVGVPITSNNKIVGTPAFMSPEQCRKEELDERSDLYSLGATFYTLLTGKTPYPAESYLDTMFGHCALPVPDPTKEKPNIPQECASIVRKAMAKSPIQRWSSASSMLDALVNLLEDSTLTEPIHDTPTVEIPDSQSLFARRGLRWVAAMITVCLAFAAYFLLRPLWSSETPPDQTNNHPVAQTKTETPVTDPKLDLPPKLELPKEVTPKLELPKIEPQKRGLKQPREVAFLDLHGQDITDDDLLDLKEFKNLASLNLSRTKVTDEGMKHLQACKNLAVLDLSRTVVTDTGLGEIKKINRVSTLCLNDTKVTDAGMKELKELEKLTLLELAQTDVSDVGMKELKELRHLGVLNLKFTLVTDVGMKELSELKQLTVLTLDNTAVSDKGLVELKKQLRLTALGLNSTKVSDVGMKEVKNFKQLTFLSLNQTNLSDAGIRELRELKELNFLSLLQTRVSDEGLKDIKEFKNLQTLFLSLTPITDAGLRELKELNHLMLLKIDNTKVTEAGIKELQEALPNCRISK